MLGQRRRRWTNIEPTMGQGLVFAEMNIHRIQQFTVIFIEYKILVW